MADTQNDLDIELIKTVFKDNEGLLFVMRKLWFGLELSQSEKDNIRSTFISPSLRTIVRKKVYGEIGDDSPIGSVPDFWLNIDPSQIIGANPGSIYQLVESKKILLSMFKKALALLENPDGDIVDVSFDPDANPSDEFRVNLLARNLYVQTMEKALWLLQTVAKHEVETPSEIIKKQKLNSNK